MWCWGVRPEDSCWSYRPSPWQLCQPTPASGWHWNQAAQTPWLRAVRNRIRAINCCCGTAAAPLRNEQKYTSRFRNSLQGSLLTRGRDVAGGAGYLQRSLLTRGPDDKTLCKRLVVWLNANNLSEDSIHSPCRRSQCKHLIGTMLITCGHCDPPTLEMLITFGHCDPPKYWLHLVTVIPPKNMKISRDQWTFLK